MKKLLSLILTSILTASIMPTASADNEVTAEEVKKAMAATALTTISEDYEIFNTVKHDENIVAENVFIRYSSSFDNSIDGGWERVSLFENTKKTKISEIISETANLTELPEYIYHNSNDDYYTGLSIHNKGKDSVYIHSYTAEQLSSMRLFFSPDDIAKIINENKLDIPQKIMFLQLYQTDYLCENEDGGVIVLVYEDSEYAILNTKYTDNKLSHYFILDSEAFISGMQGDLTKSKEAGYKNFKPEKAPEFSDISDDTSVSLLARMKIINGYPDGSFGGNRYVTRAEAAKMISVLLLNDDLNNYTNNEGWSNLEFADVPDDFWASKYINYGVGSLYIDGKGISNETYTMDIVQGYTMIADGVMVPDVIQKTYNKHIFCPEDNITEQELAKMLVCATDAFGKKMAEAEGSWPNGYVSVAKRLGICENASDKPATRLTAAHMIKNALDANVNGESSHISHNSSSDSTRGNETIYTKGIFYNLHTNNCKRVKLTGKITKKNRENEFKFTVNSDTKFQSGSFRTGDKITLLAKYGDLDSFIGQDCTVYCILRDSNLVAIMAE